MEKYLAKQIGQNLKQARSVKNLTQKEVADRLYMNQQQYNRFENGIFELNYQQILNLCAILEITPNEIFDVEFKPTCKLD